MTRLYFAFIATLLTTAPTLHAAEVFNKTTPDFRDIAAHTRTLGGGPNQRILLVLDLDNTTIKNISDLGSEHWFLWQSSLIAKGARQVPAAANSFENLLTVQNWITQMAHTQPVSPDIPAFIQEAQTHGVHVIALTSRGIDMRDATLRELTANHIRLTPGTEMGLPPMSEPSLPYDVRNPERSGLTRADLEEMKLGPARTVWFERGAFFTQGQHKGAMLRVLLHRAAARYQHIVFVDDRLSHVEAVRTAFRSRPEQLHLFNYTRSLAWIEPFNASDKRDVQAAWCNFSNGLRSSLYAQEPMVMFNTCQ